MRAGPSMPNDAAMYRANPPARTPTPKINVPRMEKVFRRMSVSCPCDVGLGSALWNTLSCLETALDLHLRLHELYRRADCLPLQMAILETGVRPSIREKAALSFAA